MRIELNKIPTKGLEVDTDIYLDKELYKNADLLDLKKLHIIGNISYDFENNLVIDLKVNGTFLLEDSLTLEPISYEFTCDVQEKIEDISSTCGSFYQKSKNILDISEILWENIVLEIPISATNATSDKMKLQGEGWELKNEDVKKIDPRLAKLTELLNERED